MNEHDRKRALVGIVLALATVLLFQLLSHLSRPAIVQRSPLQIRIAQAIHDAGIRVKWSEDILAPDLALLRARIIAYMNTTLTSGECTGSFFVPESEQPVWSSANDQPSLDQAASPELFRDADGRSHWVRNLLVGNVRLIVDDFSDSRVDPPLTPP